MIGIFGSLPFMFSELNLSFTDSVFELSPALPQQVQQFLLKLRASPGILIWRAFAMARWSWHRSHGYGSPAHAFSWRNAAIRTESYDSAEKVVPRATQLAGGIGLVYTTLTAFWAMMLTFSGMDLFEL